ncbi:AIPR family protein [Campylobacter blaseri]|uniref:Abortive phage infection protein C-terminal domain-containing protein n=1 Tax=Campylobacter blaseri TaxID=2042961 RepID=A0A2P8R0F0_9BACT|nr:AIPR family protein [Campylobacter blaseri]PSM51959.1 hypothetical protein CQ405_05185 [Campylobacter blaseri]PSM53744.1 hypothetical protein CRN67_05190 [Campylobacter blaseri]
MELILGIKDIAELSTKIIDSSFQEKVNGVINEDLGIDAVHIDENNNRICLFNFKYRDTLKKGSAKTPADLRSTNSFLGYIKDDERFNKDKEKITELTKEKIYEIIEFKKIEPEFKCELYMVSNDCTVLDEEDPSVVEFIDTYSWLDVENFNLLDLSKELAIKPDNNKASLILNDKELLQHDMDGYTTANSYVAKVNIVDLIRITSTNHKLREKESIDESSIILEQEIDINVLFDNVRGYLGSTKYNKNIISTLEVEPEKFFLFNNGLTITADDIIVKKIRMDKCYKIELINYQIVNGGQTLRSIYQFKDEHRRK